MPNQKRFELLNFHVQVGGKVSVYQGDESFPYPPHLLSQAEQEQIKTLWEISTGVGGEVTFATHHVISNKFADPNFVSLFENSFMNSLNKKLSFALSEICNVAIIAALFDACEKHQIRFGNKTKFKKFYFYGEGWPKTPKKPAGDSAVIKQFTDLEETQKPFISRLLGTTKPGLKEGGRKTPKVLIEKKDRRAVFKSRDDFFQKLYKAINESHDPTLLRIARKFGMSKDALNDLRKKVFGDKRTWPQVKKEAIKKRV